MKIISIAMVAFLFSALSAYADAPPFYQGAAPAIGSMTPIAPPPNPPVSPPQVR